MVALVAAGAACGFSKDAIKQTAGSSAQDTSAAASGAGTDRSAGDMVTLLSAGDGSRSTLRLRLHKGDRATTRFVLKLALRTTINGQTTSVDSPPVYEDLATEVLDATPEASTIRFTVVDAGAEADPLSTDSRSSDLASTENAALQKLRGLGGTVTMNDRAVVTSSRLQIPGTVDASTHSTLQQLQEQFVQLSRPLPTEPVGLGARWTVDQPITVNGISVRQRATYRLAARHGNRYSLDISGDQTAKLGPAKLPNMPSGDKALITGWKLTIDGSSDLDLTRVLPDTTTAHSAGDMSFRVEAGPDRSTLSQHLDLRLTLQRR